MDASGRKRMNTYILFRWMMCYVLDWKASTGALINSYFIVGKSKSLNILISKCMYTIAKTICRILNSLSIHYQFSML